MRLIDGERVEHILRDMAKDKHNQNATTSWANALEDFAEMISGIPTIEAEPTNHGEWLIHECFGAKDMTCSSCGWLYEYYAGMEEEWNYCPNCGARMKGVEE